MLQQRLGALELIGGAEQLPINVHNPNVGLAAVKDRSHELYSDFCFQQAVADLRK